MEKEKKKFSESMENAIDNTQRKKDVPTVVIEDGSSGFFLKRIFTAPVIIMIIIISLMLGATLGMNIYYNGQMEQLESIYEIK
ncbi:MAG: hypothetical protein K6B41_05725 [Butyrivibrio sp.]|nr:hypothetical protein [Butyrivibrio sp.]